MLTTVLRSQQEKNVEADTRIVVHVMHALVNGANVIQVRTVDTYVVVILVGTFHEMSALHPLEDIWVAFGMGKNFHFLSIKSISEYLGKGITRVTSFSFLYGIRYNISIPWLRQEVCLASLAIRHAFY